MNRVTLQPIVFENHPQGDKTYGYCIYDDHGQTYCNTWESIPDDDLEILGKVINDGDEIAQSILSYVLDCARGLYIGDMWYNWDQIEHLLED